MDREGIAAGPGLPDFGRLGLGWGEVEDYRGRLAGLAREKRKVSEEINALDSKRRELEEVDRINASTAILDGGEYEHHDRTAEAAAERDRLMAHGAALEGAARRVRRELAAHVATNSGDMKSDVLAALGPAQERLRSAGLELRDAAAALDGLARAYRFAQDPERANTGRSPMTAVVLQGRRVGVTEAIAAIIDKGTGLRPGEPRAPRTEEPGKASDIETRI